MASYSNFVIAAYIFSDLTVGAFLFYVLWRYFKLKKLLNVKEK